MGETFELGTRVVDQDDDTPNTAVVVNTPTVSCSEWDVDSDHTVATFPGNETYPDDAPVVVIVFADTLEDTYPDYAGERPLSLSKLSREGVPFYAFPEPRLKLSRTAQRRQTPVIETTMDPERDLRR